MEHPTRCAYSLNDFCRAYGISRTTAYAEHKAGRLKFIKVGVKALIAAEDAAAWLEARRAESARSPRAA